MKLGTKECDEALKRFEPKNEFEKLAIEVLLIPDDDDEAFENFTIKVCDSDLDINKLSDAVSDMYEQIGIVKEEA